MRCEDGSKLLNHRYAQKLTKGQLSLAHGTKTKNTEKQKQH